MTFFLDQDVPDDISFSLNALGHEVTHVRDKLSPEPKDQDVIAFATRHQWILITCNRDDFLALAQDVKHPGIIILIRRRSRVAERSALVHLLDRAGEEGIVNNINFA